MCRETQTSADAKRTMGGLLPSIVKCCTPLTSSALMRESGCAMLLHLLHLLLQQCMD